MNTLLNYFSIFIMNIAHAVSYVPHDIDKTQAVQIPDLPFLETIERILFLILFLILIRPLLKTSTDQKIENERKSILKWIAILGSVALLIRFVRFLSGH